LRYRPQVLALKHFSARRGITVMMLDAMTTEAFQKPPLASMMEKNTDPPAIVSVIEHTRHSIAHGVIPLEELSPNYGSARRRAVSCRPIDRRSGCRFDQTRELRAKAAVHRETATENSHGNK
jgi:hypothetical protein